MLKWTVDGDGHRGAERNELRVHPATSYDREGYTADLIACLRANPKERAEVLRGLNGGQDSYIESRAPVGAFTRRAEAAEARAEKAEAERDAALAKLAEAERGRARLDRLLGDWIGAVAQWGFGRVSQEPTPERAQEAVASALRDAARLASAERALDAARAWSESVEQGFAATLRPDIARARFNAALRAHDSSGSGAAQQSNPSRAGAETGRLVGCEPTQTPAHEAGKQSRDNASADDKTAPEPAGATRDPQAPATLADLASYIQRQVEWSAATFGSGRRTEGLCKHIEKELAEVRKDPTDVEEWVDVVILAFDGAWRAGHKPEEICGALLAKQDKNRGRTWPTPKSEDEPVEHVRDDEPRPATLADIDKLREEITQITAKFREELIAAARKSSWSRRRLTWNWCGSAPSGGGDMSETSRHVLTTRLWRMPSLQDATSTAAALAREVEVLEAKNAELERLLARAQARILAATALGDKGYP